METEEIGGIVREGALSPLCDPPCSPETYLRLECQGGSVAWHDAVLSARGEPGRGRGIVMQLRIEVEDLTGEWTTVAEVEREVYEWGHWYGVWLKREQVRRLQMGARVRVTRGDGAEAMYSLEGSHRAVRGALDACWAASRRAVREGGVDQ